MNIFYVDKCPLKAAQALGDKHVVKMILESAQMLSTAHHVAEPSTKFTPSDILEHIYKPTHLNHPSNIWCRFTQDNYGWLLRHLEALLEEYTYRYSKQHAVFFKLEYLRYYPRLGEGFTSPPQCMPDEYKLSDTVEAYRNYYRKGKSHLRKWTKREPPDWLNA